ncbi:Uncharacterised protein (plasmid) [Tsukamurella tyrosinosolvens]|uniref:Uncharacterized protein n=1 Tax=Tsukamurella tyrosinosolvens TaxID=57704 RepID=A0A1H4VEW7_TSUTY|nr:hypothetical protein [Tsukamurella tyrosinosolvens]KXO90997.1 hypothetical protein AXK58_21440 [Tsukamurella tyrosinosolvens]SEC79465.1 hypothetical protein SAMN04489793_3205 [Tsukamurella tyrosinosolvens]VEH90564.1 Uncharacterised protein [Tsukamurella tyrosinosolvens]
MPNVRSGSRILATEIHGFTPLEVEDIDGDRVTVLIDPRIGVRNERSTFPRSAVSHVYAGASWEYIG